MYNLHSACFIAIPDGRKNLRNAKTAAPLLLKLIVLHTLVLTLSYCPLPNKPRHTHKQIHHIFPLSEMLAQQQRAGLVTRHQGAAHPPRPFAAASSRAGRPRTASALPVPKADVIGEDDAAAVCSLEERFKMADIDG